MVRSRRSAGTVRPDETPRNEQTEIPRRSNGGRRSACQPCNGRSASPRRQAYDGTLLWNPRQASLQA